MRRNYKVYADIGTQRNVLSRVLSVLDTGAGPNFIRRSMLPPGAPVRQGPLPSVSDVNNNPIAMSGTVRLVVRLGAYVVKLDFIVCERLAAPVILWCDYLDRFVEAIRPRQKLV